MFFDGSSHKRDTSQGLRTERQITLFRQREEARREQAKRRETEAHVRHLNFDLFQRAVLLVLGIAIGTAIVIGALLDPGLLKLGLLAASAFGAIAAGLHRWGSKSREEPD